MIIFWCRFLSLARVAHFDDVTVFQRDTRGTKNQYNEVMVGLQGVDGQSGWHYPSKLSTKSVRKELDAHYISNVRCTSATITLQPGQTQFEMCTRALKIRAQAYVGEPDISLKQDVWVSLATSGACEVTVREEDGTSSNMLSYVSGGAVCACCAFVLSRYM